ncbi:unnamed protein product [Sphagnum jensenii]|uniref:Tyrosine specific protein phosphatases domain-containing protein n=1 Tax=Sphagnum jensenii TaxID=128206 RepID=A0ABP0VV85_9BRYO
MAQSFTDFAEITDYLIVGSHPRDAVDIRKLYYGNHVRAIENLQESGERLRGDIDAITAQCALLENRIWYLRQPLVDIGCQIPDEDPKSVRTLLPQAVGILDKAITEKVKEHGDTVYLHCCEGRGRSPSVAAAYLYWFTNDTLDAACNLVREKRNPSTPYRDAILGATYDILERIKGTHNFEESPSETFSDILSRQKDEIKRYLSKKLPAVGNAP